MKNRLLFSGALLAGFVLFASTVSACAPAGDDGGDGDAARESAAAAAGEATTNGASATYDILGAAGDVVGEVELIDGAGGVLLKAEVEGLTPGEHGFHLHETGRCEPPFSSAGGHYDPDGRDHGLLSAGGAHAGDLPNLVVEEGEETTRAHAFADGLSIDELHEGDASALVIHAGADDYRTDPAGAAGDRVACAEIAAR